MVTLNNTFIAQQFALQGGIKFHLASEAQDVGYLSNDHQELLASSCSERRSEKYKRNLENLEQIIFLNIFLMCRLSLGMPRQL
jgi:hypothetical protein